MLIYKGSRNCLDFNKVLNIKNLKKRKNRVKKYIRAQIEQKCFTANLGEYLWHFISHDTTSEFKEVFLLLEALAHKARDIRNLTITIRLSIARYSKPFGLSDEINRPELTNLSNAFSAAFLVPGTEVFIENTSWMKEMSVCANKFQERLRARKTISYRFGISYSGHLRTEKLGEKSSFISIKSGFSPNFSVRRWPEYEMPNR